MYPPLYQSPVYESIRLSTYLRWSQRVKAHPAESPLPALWCLEKTLTVFVVFAVVQSLSRVRLCHPMDCSTPSFPVLHYQTHVHWVDDGHVLPVTNSSSSHENASAIFVCIPNMSRVYKGACSGESKKEIQLKGQRHFIKSSKWPWWEMVVRKGSYNEEL